MSLNYLSIFKWAVVLLLIMVVLEWLPTNVPSIADVLPSGRHSAEYNRFAWIMMLLGVAGLLRLLRKT